MSNRSALDYQWLHSYSTSGRSADVVKVLLEYIAREQDAEAQNQLFRQLLDKYVHLTRKLHGHIEQIETQSQELERLNRQKNEFLGIAAHDLRNPLSAVQVYSEVLLGMLNENLSDKQRDFLERIHQSSLFMSQLIDDLLDISRIESGTLVLEKRPADYLALVRNNVQINTVLAEKKDISIEFQEKPPIPELWLDSQKIEQVLNNLLNNAIKYSHPQTSIMVCVQRNGSSVLTEVSDQGLGIPEDELPHIFKTFHTSSVRAPQGEKSTGLGLAIVRKIVEGHGGSIGVESRVGMGSTFYFHLPLAKNRQHGNLSADIF